MNEKVFCSGLWHVPGNRKRTIEHYESYLPATISMLKNSTLYFHSNQSGIIETVQDLCIRHKVSLVARRIEIADLPGCEIAEKLVESCERMKLDALQQPVSSQSNEKGRIHYWRDLKGSGREVYRDILTIWMSKIPLAASLSSETDKTSVCTWIDASIARVNGKRTNWDFTKLMLPLDRLSHYGSRMRFYGIQLPLSAGVLGGGTEVWMEVKREFEWSSSRAAEMAYGHDEETILADCVWRKPELFNCIGSPKPPTAPIFQKLIGRVKGFFSETATLT